MKETLIILGIISAALLLLKFFYFQILMWLDSRRAWKAHNAKMEKLEKEHAEWLKATILITVVELKRRGITLQKPEK